MYGYACLCATYVDCVLLSINKNRQVVLLKPASPFPPKTANYSKHLAYLFLKWSHGNVLLSHLSPYSNAISMDIMFLLWKCQFLRLLFSIIASGFVALSLLLAWIKTVCEFVSFLKEFFPLIQLIFLHFSNRKIFKSNKYLIEIDTNMICLFNFEGI